MTKPDYSDSAFTLAANDLAAALRDSTVNNSLPWVPITDLYHIAEDLLMQGWAKPRTTNTINGLDALPNGTIIRDHKDRCLRARTYRETNRGWAEDGGMFPYPSSEVALPATILWEPATEPNHSGARAAIKRMRAEGERHFNEQVAKVQEDTGSTVLEMLEAMNELGLHREATRYERHQKECMLDSDGQEATP